MMYEDEKSTFIFAWNNYPKRGSMFYPRVVDLLDLALIVRTRR